MIVILIFTVNGSDRNNPPFSFGAILIGISKRKGAQRLWGT
jgi:hypothetical protein